MIYVMTTSWRDIAIKDKLEKNLTKHLDQAEEIFKYIQKLMAEESASKAKKKWYRSKSFVDRKTLESNPEYWTKETVASAYFWGKWRGGIELTTKARDKYAEYQRILNNVAVVGQYRNAIEDSETKEIHVSENEYQIIKQYI